MAFAVPCTPNGTKRLKAIQPDGTELRQSLDPMDMSYMRLLETSGASPEDAAPPVEEVPDAQRVVTLFEEARGNLDVLVDVITNLERAFVEAKPFSAGRRPGLKREDELTNNLLARIAGTHGSLGRVAARLRQGAAALQSQVDRQDVFYRQLAQLQRVWKIHLNPKIIDCPYVVDLSLPSASSSGGGGEASGAAAAADPTSAASGPINGNTYAIASRSLLVPLMKGSDGLLRVQVELPKERPSANDPPNKQAPVYAVCGARRVHTLLLQLHRRLLWQLVCQGLDRDALAVGAGANSSSQSVLIALAKLAARRIEHTADPGLAALRPLLLEHLMQCRLPPQAQPPPPRPHARPVAAQPLLPDLAALLNQIVFREHQRHRLDLEVRSFPFVRLHWRPSSNMLTSAMDVHIGPNHRILLVIRDGRTDVEGVVHRTGRQAGSGAGASRWVRDTHMSFSRHDVPCVLRSVLQTLGLQLQALLGLQEWEQPSGAAAVAPAPAAAAASVVPVASPGNGPGLPRPAQLQQ